MVKIKTKIKIISMAETRFILLNIMNKTYKFINIPKSCLN